MIEALIGYLEDQGYTVGVFPGRLMITQECEGSRFSYTWAISQWELRVFPYGLNLMMAQSIVRTLSKVEAGREADFLLHEHLLWEDGGNVEERIFDVVGANAGRSSCRDD